MERDVAAYALGIETAGTHIAEGKLIYRWTGHVGHWGYWIVNELARRFGMKVNDGFGVCFVTVAGKSFDEGYNATLAAEIDRRYGAGVFQAVFTESRQQSETSLGDAKRAWLTRQQ